VRIETPGGGGYGDPRKRTEKAVQNDLRLGYITAAAARQSYPSAAKPGAKEANKKPVKRLGKRVTRTVTGKAGTTRRSRTGR